MPDRPEVRILLRPRPGGKVALSVLDPRSNRESHGPVVPRANLDAEIRKIKAQLERSGSWVSAVKELS